MENPEAPAQDVLLLAANVPIEPQPRLEDLLVVGKKFSQHEVVWAGIYPALAQVGDVIIVLVQAVQRKGVAKSDKPFIPREAIKPVLQVVIPSTLMVFLTEYIGLYFAAGLYLAVYMRWIGRNRWRTVLLLSIVVPAASYIVFDRLFLIPMPTGRLPGILPF